MEASCTGTTQHKAAAATVARTTRPASIAFRAFDEVASHVECRRQLQHDVGQRRMFEQFRPGQGWFAAGPLMPAAKATVQPERNVTKHEPQNERPQKIVTEKLHVRRI